MEMQKLSEAQPTGLDPKNAKWSKISKTSLVIVSILVIVVGTFTLIYINSAKPSTCTSSACVKFAAEIMDSIDETVDPCADFYGFVCGNFLKSSIGESNSDIQRRTIHTELLSLLESAPTRNESKALRHQKLLYWGCMDEEAIEEDDGSSLLGMIEDLGGWPVLEKNWTDRGFDWITFQYKAVEFGLTSASLFDFEEVVVEEEGRRKEYFKISPPPKIGDVVMHNPYLEYMKDVAKLFGSSKAAANEQFLPHVFGKNIEEILTVNDEHCERMTLKDVQDRFNGINWLEYLSHMVPNKIFRKDTEVIFAADRYVHGLLQLVRAVNLRTKTNYLVWKIVEANIAYLKSAFARTYKYHDMKMRYESGKNFSSQSETRQEFCFRTATHSVPFALETAYVQKLGALNPEIEDMFGAIKMELIKTLSDNSWLPVKMRNLLLGTVYDVEFVYNAPPVLFKEGFVDALLGFDEETDDSLTFFELIALSNRRKYLRKFTKEKLSIGDVTPSDLVQLGCQYRKPNAVYLSPSSAKGLFFDANRPKYLNYATLGSTLGHRVVNAIVNKFSSTNETQLWFKNASQIFEERIGRLFQNATTLKDTTAHSSGVKLAYNVYQSYVEREGDEELLPGLQYMQNQLFWISYALPFCAKSSTEDGDAHEWVSLTVKSSRNFAQDFQCPVDAEKTCDVF